MSCVTNCCTFLRGELLIGDSLSACAANNSLVCANETPLKKMGNIESASISITSQILGTENRFHKNKPCSRMAIQSAELSLTVRCTSLENMNLALYSKNHEGDFLVGYTQDFLVCDESVLRKCNFFLFHKNGVNLSTVIVTVYDEDDNLLETVNASNYDLTPHGIELLNDLNIVGARTLRIQYSYDDRQEINPSLNEFDFLSEFKGHKYLYFKGTNYADGVENEDPFGVEIYRVLFNPISQIDLISQGSYFVINLVGRIEKDFAKADNGFGGYYKIRRGRYT